MKRKLNPIIQDAMFMIAVMQFMFLGADFDLMFSLVNVSLLALNVYVLKKYGRGWYEQA